VGKNLPIKKLIFFYLSRVAVYLSLASRMSKLQEKPSALKRECAAFQNLNFPDPDPNSQCGSGSADQNQYASETVGETVS
jgi:hypothetical protein